MPDHRSTPFIPNAAISPGVRALLSVPAGYGGHGMSLGTSAATALGRLLSRCDHDVAIAAGDAPGYDPETLLRRGVPCAHRGSPAARCVAGLFDGRGEMTAYVDLVRNWGGAGRWCVGALVVDPSLRGCGIGSGILEEVERWAKARGARSLVLHVPGRHAGALAFARRSGFSGEAHGCEHCPHRMSAMERSIA